MLAGPLEVLVGSPMSDRSKVRGPTNSNLPVLNVGVLHKANNLSFKNLNVTETTTRNSTSAHNVLP